MTKTAILLKRLLCLIYLLGNILLINAAFSQSTCENAAILDLTDPLVCPGDTTKYIISDRDADNNSITCAIDGDSAVWVAVTIPADATELTVSMADYGGCVVFNCQSNLVAGLYSGNCGSLTAIDDCIDLSTGVLNEINLGPWLFTGLTGGSTYLWRLSEEDNDVGFAEFHFETNGTCPPPPSNNLCVNAIPLFCDDTLTGNTSLATSDLGLSTCTTPLNTAPGVWYSFMGSGDPALVSLCGSSFDTKLGLFSGDCESPACVIGNDDFCGIQSEVLFNTLLGTTYYIYVTGFNSEVGSYQIAYTCPILGCTDPEALNFDSLATYDDGSCVPAPPSCGDDYYDNGGPAADYTVNETDTVIICADTLAYKVSVDFSFFSMENNGSNCFDELFIYDGNSPSSPVISSPNGTTDGWCWDRDDASPSGSGDLQGMIITSSDISGCLTFVFKSDGSVLREGWEAAVSCSEITFPCNPTSGVFPGK